MSKVAKAVPGTKDILPEEIGAWYRIEKLSRKIFSRYNFREIRTPIFESTSLFSRGIGEETDIVSKEMYTFRDKGEDLLTLRPEMTAPVVRAFIEHSMYSQSQITKLFYFAPMFRQERPQAGRLRQFHQFGAEILGSSSPYSDCEIILSAAGILKAIGLKDLTIKINSLGTPASREIYKEKLRLYLNDHLTSLSPESQKRYHTNILRIFDSKEEQDKKIMAGAPLLYEYLDEESRAEFNLVEEMLSSRGISYQPDYQLVRGLDYYTKTTFEIISGKVGSQSALCGGGRYDNLVSDLGGPSVPGVGFAAGVERILLAAKNEGIVFGDAIRPDVYIANLKRDDSAGSFRVAQELRDEDISAEMDILGRSMKAQMREANKLEVSFVVILGGDESKDGNCTIKNMKNSSQEVVPLNQIVIFISRNLHG
ncbi:MAG: histidine--tRNA ligase [Ignavibacteriaceae bacterium]|nr:histidine--tRNA ligase [Ignavibacteriaceae bacterium]